MSAHDVFISHKNLDSRGMPTRDASLAREVYEALTAAGLRVFLSAVSLESLGVAAYKQAIDEALDQSKVLVAVGTSRQHLESQWVHYEWDSFSNDILSGVKLDGRIFAYVDNVAPSELPRTLRQIQVFSHPDGLPVLANFVCQALGQISPEQAQHQIDALLARCEADGREQLGTPSAWSDWKVLGPVLDRHGGRLAGAAIGDIVRSHEPEAAYLLLRVVTGLSRPRMRYVGLELARLAMGPPDARRECALRTLCYLPLELRDLARIRRWFRVLLAQSRRADIPHEELQKAAKESMAGIDPALALAMLETRELDDDEAADAEDATRWDGTFRPRHGSDHRWWQCCENMYSSVEPDVECIRCGYETSFAPREGERLPPVCPHCGFRG